MSIDSFYTAMAGLQAVRARMDALSSNLANLQTPGFAAIQALTEAAPYQGANAPSGADVIALAPGGNTLAGPLTHTGNPMNLGFTGDAWLEVQTSNGPALTRNGAVQITTDGILSDSNGNPVLGTDGSPISLPRLASLSFGSDGSISGVPASQPGGQSQRYGQVNLVATPAAPMTSLGGSIFLPSNPAALQQSQVGAVSQGYLNASNVDPTQEIVELVDASRSYQLQTELMKMQTGGGQQLNAMLAQG
ncbi:MAG: flagellar hook basal-body protein [Proteobacteria bacterium]|nr:flagellar hook basal-body protein [Pseudomonadota bacterium]